MSRLIDADALDFYEALKGYYGDAWRDAQAVVDDAPTIDIEERLNDAYAHGWSDAEAKYHDAVEVVRLRNLTDEELKHYHDSIDKKARTITNVFSNADAVEVVRCKECKWYNSCYKMMEFHAGHEDRYGFVEIDYCSYGERG